MKKIKATLLFCMLLLPYVTFAQNSREYIRNAIRGWGECRNVAITRTNGDLALYADNGCARSGVPKSLNDAISELNHDRKYIDDIQLTENGKWLILYGNNGLKWNNIPGSLESMLRDYNNNGEVITAVTFNDDGDWIIISTEHISASSPSIQDWVAEGMDSYGGVQTACITDDGCVVVYENGYRFLGNVPNDLKTALKETKLDVYRLKIAGTAWFFADKSGRYRYNM